MGLEIALIIVGSLIGLIGTASLIVTGWLAMKYLIYNNKLNSSGLTGEQVARKVLDDNDLSHIKVKVTGSLLFGNSYSHVFKKVRLRRISRNEQSVTALGMGAQKACLAILDKEGDKDMKKRIKLYPLITFGPFAFVPLILIGTIISLPLLSLNSVI